MEPDGRGEAALAAPLSGMLAVQQGPVGLGDADAASQRTWIAAVSDNFFTVLGAFSMGALLILAVAIANAADLLFARTADRDREQAVRCAIGASRRRVLQQLLTESTLLALLAGAIGFLGALWIGDAFTRVLADVGGDIPPLADYGTDWRVFVFTIAAALAAGMLAALLPAWRVTRVSLLPVLKHAAVTPGIGPHRVRSLPGATAINVTRLVAGQSLRLAVIGLMAGLPLAWLAMRPLGSVLVGIAPADPVVFTVVPLLVLGVALAPCWLPARRETAREPDRRAARGVMYDMIQDLRFALRQLAKAPGFTATVVLSLARGIGAHTTAFCWIQGTLLRPLPRIAAQGDVVTLVSSEGSGNVSRPDVDHSQTLSAVFAGVLVSTRRSSYTVCRPASVRVGNL